jgi:aspartate racemase
MKTLGLIGGTSWVSTVDYYRIINQKINERLGGLNAARLILYSMNYEEFKPPLIRKIGKPLQKPCVISQKNWKK